MKKRSILKTAAVSVFLAAAVLAFPAKAQETNPNGDGLQISPLRYDWNVGLGDKKNGTVFLKNLSDKPIDVTVDVQDFSVSDNIKTEPQFFVPDANHPLKAYDVINWISIDNTPFTLQPGEVKNIPFAVTIPDKTPTGGYYGVLFFVGNTQDQASNAAAQIKPITRLGVLLTMAVKGQGDVDEAGIVKMFSSDRQMYFKNPVSFLAQAANTGNFPFKVSGTIDISKFGKPATSVNIDPKILYPNRTRQYDNLSWNFSPFDFGKFNAKLHLVSEDGSVVLDSVTSFWVIPWQLIAAVGGIILILLVGYSMGKLQRKK